MDPSLPGSSGAGVRGRGRTPSPFRGLRRFCGFLRLRSAAIALASVALLVLGSTTGGAQTIPNVNPNNARDVMGIVDNVLTAVIDFSAEAQVLAWGERLAQGIVVILVIVTGARIALSGRFDPWELVKFFLILAIPLGLLQFYDAPFVRGLTFPELVTRQGDALAALFGVDVLSTALGSVVQLGENFASRFGGEAETESVGAVVRRIFGGLTGGIRAAYQLALLAALTWAMVLALLVVVALAMAQIIFAKIAVTIFVLLGPIFIPFMIVPKIDFLFWGWLKGLVQYSLYSAIAAAMIALWASVIQAYAQYLVTAPIWQTTIGAVFTVALPVFVIVICAIVSILKIGDIAGTIVGAGSDGGGFFGGAFMAGRIVAAPARVVGGAATAPLKGGLPT